MHTNQVNNGKSAVCIVLAVLILLSAGCREDRDIPNVEHIDASFSLYRFEQDLWALDSLATDEELDSVKVLYPVFWDLFFTNIMPVEQATPDVTNRQEAIRLMLADERLRTLYDEVEQRYSDISSIENGLYRAFQYYQYYFPGNRSPNVYTLISDFGFFPFIFDDGDRDGIGISLEFFLGNDFPYRQFAGTHPAFAEYLMRTYNEDHVVRKAVEVVVDDLLGPPPGDRLVDLMIHNGKKLYLLQHFLPETADSVIFEYSPEQIEWCTDNERNLWAHYLQDDLLYSNRYMEINKLVSYSPNVPGLPPETPGRVANWSGCRIIHTMKERNPEMSMIDIVATRDAQRILELARYRPE